MFPIVSRVDGKVITLANMGRDAHFGMEVGDWVEIVDDDYVLHHKAEPLLRVEQIDVGNARMTLSETPIGKVGRDLSKHPLLRRWDQKVGDPKKGFPELQDDGTAVVREGTGDKSWWTLEDGVQIQFNPADPANHYRTGDYWLIPARTATGDVVWPQEDGTPKTERPRGIETLLRSSRDRFVPPRHRWRHNDHDPCPLPPENQPHHRILTSCPETTRSVATLMKGERVHPEGTPEVVTDEAYHSSPLTGKNRWPSLANLASLLVPEY